MEELFTRVHPADRPALGVQAGTVAAGGLWFGWSAYVVLPVWAPGAPSWHRWPVAVGVGALAVLLLAASMVAARTAGAQAARRELDAHRAAQARDRAARAGRHAAGLAGELPGGRWPAVNGDAGGVAGRRVLANAAAHRFALPAGAPAGARGAVRAAYGILERTAGLGGDLDVEVPATPPPPTVPGDPRGQVAVDLVYRAGAGGMSSEDLVAQLEGMGVAGDGTRPLLASLVGAGVLVYVAGRYVAAAYAVGVDPVGPAVEDSTMDDEQSSGRPAMTFREAREAGVLSYPAPPADDDQDPVTDPDDPRWLPAVRRLAEELVAEVRPEDGHLAGRGVSQVAAVMVSRVPELDAGTVQAFVRDYMEIRAGYPAPSGRNWRGAMPAVRVDQVGETAG